MPSDVGSWFQQGPGNASSALGQVSAQALTWTDPDAVTVGAASGTLQAGVTAGSTVGRVVRVKVPVTASVGIHINRGGAAATTSKCLIEPGETEYFSTEQAITAIRAGSTDVTVYVSVGVV